jgi:hypothetical protein
MAQLPVPILSYDELRVRAARFLDAHHPTGVIPVPIEEIAEFQLGLDIVPTPGLHKGFDIDAFISSDLRTIYILMSLSIARALGVIGSASPTKSGIEFCMPMCTRHCGLGTSRNGGGPSLPLTVKISRGWYTRPTRSPGWWSSPPNH